MLFKPPFRIIASGAVAILADGTSLRSIMSFKRVRSTYRLASFAVLPSERPVPSISEGHESFRVNDCSALEVGIHLLLVRTEPIDGYQEAFEALERKMLRARFENRDTLTEVAENAAKAVLKTCNTDRRLVFTATLTAWIMSLYWLEFSNQLTAVNRDRSVKALTRIFPRIPFTIQEWIDTRDAMEPAAE